MQSSLAVYPTVAPPTMTMPMSVSPHSGHQHQISGLLGGVQTTTTPNTGTVNLKTTGTMNTGTTRGLANSNTAGTNGTGNGNAPAAPLSTGAQNRLKPGSSMGLGSGWSADLSGASKSGATDIMGSTVSLATTMGTATPALGAGKPTPTATPRPVDPVKASVAHLLTKAYSLPCSTAAQAFTHLVQPMARFQLALDALLPLLDAGAVDDGKMCDAEGLEGVQVHLAEVSRYMRVLSHIIDAYV